MAVRLFPHLHYRKELKHPATVSSLALVTLPRFLLCADVRSKYAERRYRTKGRVLADWRTTPPTFKPTFKLAPGTKEFQYDRKRVPSWCDRVLWKSLPGAAGCIEQYEYVVRPLKSIFRNKPRGDG